VLLAADKNNNVKEQIYIRKDHLGKCRLSAIAEQFQNSNPSGATG